MGRFGGGRGFGGGVGGGGNNLVRDAAAINGYRSFADHDWTGSQDKAYKVWYCENIVTQFELCAAFARADGVKVNTRCQEFQNKLENRCAEFERSWSDWWSTAKKDYIDMNIQLYDMCVERDGKDKCKYSKELLFKRFGVVVD